MAYYFKKYLSLIFISFSLIFSGTAVAEDIRIAVRANKGAAKSLKKWQATADYLSEKIPPHRFIIIPFENNSALNQAVSRDEFHFCITNPASAVEHTVRYGAQPIATLLNKRQGKGYSQFGSVIFTRADRKDINTLDDLRGKIFLGVDELGFGGWRVAWRELLKNKINPYQDFKEIRFAGGKQQKVIFDVRDGRVDAGSVRTDMLERLAEAGNINLNEYKVLGQKKTESFPFLHSTDLYPEWLFSIASKISNQLKTQVISALYSMPADSVAAINGKYVGWISPMDYTPVDELLKDLGVGPYTIARMGSYTWLLDNYGQIIFLVIFIIILLFSSLLFVLRQKKLIAAGQNLLLKEMKKRETLELQLFHSQKIESLGQLTGGIAHDFNNMLASILGYTELALLTDSVTKDSKLSRYLNQVMTSGESAKMLVNQMLAFSRSNETVEETEVFSVSEVIEHTYKFLQPLIPSSINISVKINEKDYFINANKGMIEQVLMNLCLNSKDAIVDNKGSIVLSSEVVVLDKNVCDSCHMDVSGTYVSIQIEDTGKGMDALVQKRLFEPFFSTKEVGKGTGMGLSIVHGIIHNHHGHILVDSEVGKGTIIKILLPQALKDNNGLENDLYSQDSIISLSLTGKHVLVVDDEIYIANYISDLLTKYGAKVTSKTNSEDAFSFYEDNYSEIDLVITDQTMPNLTGHEMAINMLKISPDASIILCTGYSEDVNEKIALNNHIKAFFKKPIKSQELLSSIDSIFK
jgi:signal transduction histidine kinase/CheY-like chemotaxis protein